MAGDGDSIVEQGRPIQQCPNRRLYDRHITPADIRQLVLVFENFLVVTRRASVTGLPLTSGGSWYAPARSYRALR